MAFILSLTTECHIDKLAKDGFKDSGHTWQDRKTKENYKLYTLDDCSPYRIDIAVSENVSERGNACINCFVECIEMGYKRRIMVRNRQRTVGKAPEGSISFERAKGHIIKNGEHINEKGSWHVVYRDGRDVAETQVYKCGYFDPHFSDRE